MEKRKLGRQGLEGSALGLGCMGMSWAYGGSDESQSIRVLHHALDIGVNFWDTAETYGPVTNEEFIRRAHKVHPLSAVQSEYSSWTRGVEEKVLPTLRELGIGLVAYSPIGRGFLSGKIKSLNDLSESDWRRNNPRFQGENFQQNFKLAEIVQKIASANHATAAQVALAWVLRQGNDIVPIPGTRHIEYLNENVKAVGLKLPESAWSELDRQVRSFEVAGARYTEAAMKMLDTTE